MKKIGLLLIALTLTISCNSQEKNKNDSLLDTNKSSSNQPQGTWTVNKEFDKDGNLIRYDSIYSWSSGYNLDNLASLNRDSTMKSLQSKFYRHFSGIDTLGYGNLFAQDSLFVKRFFTDDFFDSEFGKDFMDINRINERMEAMQQNFLKKYQSEFNSARKEQADN